MNMEVRHPANPRDFESYTTERIREEFLVRDLFKPGRVRLVYSYIDRMIIGGVCPEEPLPLAGGPELGTDYFLERRELGVMNLGGPGRIQVEGEEHSLAKTDCLFVGQGSREVVFASDDPSHPARFYLLSGPAHARFPAVKITKAQALSEEIGSPAACSRRILNKYIHPGGVPSANLVMGLTEIQPNSVWNSFPCHTHARRMEVYLYFDLPEDAVLFHLMGKPEATRHIVVRNEEAVISPSWSIHCGVATSHYTFVWGMLGDNQVFSDMDHVSLDRIQ
jgi:4-deoxy-L-threo-5-hexosulose-uronate ketol-isomerase